MERLSETQTPWPAYPFAMATTYTLPDQIEVVRTPEGTFHVFIDGVELPYAISAAEPVSVDLERREPPKVRLTLIASSVHVRDDLFAGSDLSHECDPEVDEEVEE